MIFPCHSQMNLFRLSLFTHALDQHNYIAITSLNFTIFGNQAKGQRQMPSKAKSRYYILKFFKGTVYSNDPENLEKIRYNYWRTGRIWFPMQALQRWSYENSPCILWARSPGEWICGRYFAKLRPTDRLMMVKCEATSVAENPFGSSLHLNYAHLFEKRTSCLSP